MKRVLIIILCCLAMTASAFGKGKSAKTTSMYYDSGVLYNVEIRENFCPRYGDFFPRNITAGIGYRMGNGFDSSLVIGVVGDSPMRISALSYIQFRYHFFNYKYSPFVSLGVGMDYHHNFFDFAPTARASVGLTLGRYSLFFAYAESWISVDVGEGVSTRIGTTLPYLGFSVAF